jgi:hypothetical protein
MESRTMRIPIDPDRTLAYDVKKASGGIGFFVGGLVPVYLG